jgi:serine/threonine-protein kinase
MPRAQQLGRYQLLDRLAFGGMAEIFRAKTFDAEGRQLLVAVKRVLGHLTSDSEFLRMMVDEAKVSASLKHPNIARVYEFAHHNDEYFLAMEYVDGKDVRALLERHRQKKRPIPHEHAAWIAMEVAEALHAAHTTRDPQGRPLHIVHRDISPSNILLAYTGEVKLCDFGIAKATLTRVQTRTGVIKGKVKYMSPEQAMGRKLDGRSDLFSLGTVLFEMLTLQAPFTAATEVDLIFAVRDAQKRDARDIDRTIPGELNDILNKIMTRSRSSRFQTGQELAAALRHFLERYKPGYRRSHFARFMRKLFAEDIERELRVLEEYVIDTGAADPEDVGENLIADALPEDAPYTQFTAASGGGGGGTRIGSRSSKLRNVRGTFEVGPTPVLGDVPQPSLHERGTMLIKRPPSDEPSAPRLPSRVPRDKTPPKPIAPRPLASRRAPPPNITPVPKDATTDPDPLPELQALPTRIFAPVPESPTGQNLHQDRTQIFRHSEERPQEPARRRTKTAEVEEEDILLDDDDLFEDG